MSGAGHALAAIARGARLLVLCAVVAAPVAEARSGADTAWIERCVAARRGGTESAAGLRRYCACMQDLVGDDGPFGVTELERTYPPAHRRCWRRPGRS